MRIAIEELEIFCVTALCRVGVSEPDARTTAGVLVLADAWGVFTHGVRNLGGYLRRLQAGGIRPAGRPRITADGPAWALVDGDATLGMVSGVFAMRTAMDKARACGLGYAGLRNTCHFGAAGCYAVMAARDGMIGLAMANDTPTVTAPGAAGAVFGSNPFSFAAPAGDEPPVVLDMATSTVAGGKVFLAASRGESIPEGWVVDGQGNPTTNPTVFTAFPHRGSLTPMAAHKGYGLAFMIETLTSILAGAGAIRTLASWSFADPSIPTDHSAAFFAVDLASMPTGRTFQDSMSRMIREIRALPKAGGIGRICVPGELEWARYARAAKEGIDLPPEAVSALRQVAQSLGLNIPPGAA